MTHYLQITQYQLSRKFMFRLKFKHTDRPTVNKQVNITNPIFYANRAKISQKCKLSLCLAPVASNFSTT
jgi:hypothetical protein